MNEPIETWRKRLYMRSIRRGIKEMDVVLGGFAQSALEQMPPADLKVYDALLKENDHDLYAWVSGRSDVPAQYADMMSKIAASLGNS